MLYSGRRYDGRGEVVGTGYYSEIIDLNGSQIKTEYIHYNSGWYRVEPDSVKIKIFNMAWVALDDIDRSKPDINSVKFYERQERYEFIKKFGYEDTLRNIRLDQETGRLKATFFGGGVKTITSAVEIAFLAEHFKI